MNAARSKPCTAALATPGSRQVHCQSEQDSGAPLLHFLIALNNIVEITFSNISDRNISDFKHE